MEAKKNASKNFETTKVIFFQAGLVIALVMVFMAFQWKKYERRIIEDRGGEVWITDIDIPPVTIPERPEPPPPPESSFTPVDDTFDDLLPDFTMNVDVTALAPVPDFVPAIVPAPQEEAPDNMIFIAAEQMPEFPGGQQALLDYLARNTRYPARAREMNLQGTVFVSFVVEPDGSVSNIEVMRGIGGGCDEVAVEALRNMPRWSPGMQSGKPVRVAYSARMVFRLK